MHAYKSTVYMRLANEARIGIGLPGACVVLRLGPICQSMQPVSVSIMLPSWYWVRNLDSSLSPLTVGVVWVGAFCSTLRLCTVEMLMKNQASSNAWTEQNRIEIR
jgi:hypothetical protein